jgi:hypothetical protein
LLVLQPILLVLQPLPLALQPILLVLQPVLLILLPNLPNLRPALLILPPVLNFLETFLPKRQRKNVVTGVTPAAYSRSNTGQNDIHIKQCELRSFNSFISKKSKLRNFNHTSLENLFFKKYWLKKNWGSSHKMSVFQTKVLGPKNSQTSVTF